MNGLVPFQRPPAPPPPPPRKTQREVCGAEVGLGLARPAPWSRASCLQNREKQRVSFRSHRSVVLCSSSENGPRQQPTSTGFVIRGTSTLGFSTWRMCEDRLANTWCSWSCHVNTNQAISTSASKDTGSSMWTYFGFKRQPRLWLDSSS